MTNLVYSGVSFMTHGITATRNVSKVCYQQIVARYINCAETAFMLDIVHQIQSLLQAEHMSQQTISGHERVGVAREEI